MIRSDKPELLAPAGDWEAMRAAVANGADAVYFGLENFNARHRATNFHREELPEIMAYLHAHNVKGFLTFNTLIFSDELGEAEQYIKEISAAGVDAVIVQDLGLAKLIHEMAPTLHIHGSTQMTLTEPRGIEFVKKLGVQRVVLARELSIEDIRKITGATDMPLEVFIHGALCVAYSGQCLTSESLGGRSANRGQCAQACRLPYELIVDGQMRELGDRAYLLSPQDLAAYELVDDLTQIGVASFKIEGRLKSAHYVAATTQTYRQAIDDSHFRISPQQRADLEQTFSRGFSHGFLSGVNHQELVVGRFPKARGSRIGTVSKISPHSILVTLSTQHTSLATLKPGDGIVFDEGHPEQDEQGGRIFEVALRGKNQIEIEFRRGDVNLSAISPDAIVWKTDDPAIRKRLEHSFSRDNVVRRIPLNITVRANEFLELTFSDGSNDVSVRWDKTLEKAQKFPFSEAIAREQLSRLGDTPFELADLNVQIEGQPMVPKSVLNDLRRQAVQQLVALREKKHAIREGTLERLRAAGAASAPGDARSSAKAAPTPQLIVLARTLDQVDAALASNSVNYLYCDFEDVRKYPEAVARCRASNMNIALATLRIIKPSEEGLLKYVHEAQPDAVLVRNLAAITYFKENLPMIGDYSLNVANELTANLFADEGLIRMVPSHDLNWKQLNAMISRSDPSRFEFVVHQHMPMFHMEHCIFCFALSTGKDYRDCGRPCEKHKVELRDRVGQPHPLIADVGCRNTLFNAQAQSAAEYIPQMIAMGARYFRIELMRQTAAEVEPLIRRYRNIIEGKEAPKSVLRSLRVLNQLGVTAGTLEAE